MNPKIISIFNLIEIFGQPRKQDVQNVLRTQANCETHHHHDFYCDSEKPFISIQQ